MSLTVAELKRRIKPGVKLQSIYVPGSRFVGPDDPFFTNVATVVRAMSTQFTVNRPYKGPTSESYCSFPKASELQETEKGFRIVRGGGDVELEYEWR